MENKKSINFFLGIIAVILGWTLFKQFDFENLKFKHTALAIVYLVCFVFSIYCLMKNYKNRPEK
jgi:predicted ferric reductase